MPTALEELIDTWRAFDPHTHPFILNEEKEMVEDFCYRFSSYNDYIQSPLFENIDPKKFHVDLLPIPYIGNLATARIFILLLNPGFGHHDYFSESNVPEYRERLVRNLRQEHGDENPFMFLDPRFCWHGGYAWWRKTFGNLIDLVAERRGRGMQEALFWFGSQVASLELIPYHSRDGGNVDQLVKAGSKSAILVRNFLQEVNTADKGEKLFIVTRKVKQWGISGPNVLNYESKHARGASLNLKSAGGKAIRDFLKL